MLVELTCASKYYFLEATCLMNSPAKSSLFSISVMLIVILLSGACTGMARDTVNLPTSIGAWTRPDSVRSINSSNIFDYMNGAGELYLAYRFSRLDVYEYTSEKQGVILVEVYFMDSPDDAFGLLSVDWSGESIPFKEFSMAHTEPGIAPSHRALYGQGYLRLAAGNLYARVLAERETPELKKAIFSLGQAIAEGRTPPAEPDLLKVLPLQIDSEWKLRTDRIGYFRSHLVLNSLYYLSYQNILKLDHSAEAVTAPYENKKKDNKRIQLLFVKYDSEDKARQALDSFHTSYLPDHRKGPEEKGTPKHIGIFNIEDGWLGYKCDGRSLVIIFECPDKTSAEIIMENIHSDTIK